MRLLGWLGAIFIVAWLVLWLALKVSFAAIHVLVAIGLLLLIVAFARGFSTRKTEPAYRCVWHGARPGV